MSIGVSQFVKMSRQTGQGMAEYIIIVIIVGVCVLIGIRYFGDSVMDQFENASTDIVSLRSKELSDNVHSELERGDKRETRVAKTRKAKITNESSKEVDVDFLDSMDGNSLDSDGAESERDRRIARLEHPGIGGDSKSQAERIQLDWTTLSLIAVAVCLIAVWQVIKYSRSTQSEIATDDESAET